MVLMAHGFGVLLVGLSMAASLLTSIIHMANFFSPGHGHYAAERRFVTRLPRPAWLARFGNPGSLFVAAAWFSVTVTLGMVLRGPSGHVYLNVYLDSAYVTMLSAAALLGCISAALSRAQR